MRGKEMEKTEQVQGPGSFLFSTDWETLRGRSAGTARFERRLLRWLSCNVVGRAKRRSNQHATEAGSRMASASSAETEA